MSLLFNHPYKALVIGSAGAIGQAFVDALQADPLCQHVECVSRSLHGSFDLEDAQSIAATAQACRSAGPFHLLIDATGALMLAGVGPEKSLAALQQDHLARAFQINAIGPALGLRYFSPLLAPGHAIYAKLSARVGSISDNKKGGWYGYRASKAALNMLLQTAAIELQRKNPALKVIALQPGTVQSALSKPFSAALDKLLAPQESVEGMLAAMQNLPAKQGAYFIDYKGQEIGW